MSLEQVQNRSQDNDPRAAFCSPPCFTVTDNTDCTDKGLRRTDSFYQRHYLLFRVSTHARTHALKNTHQKYTARICRLFGLTAALFIPPYCLRSSVEDRQRQNFVPQTILLAELLLSKSNKWPSHPWSLTHSMSVILVSKITNLHLRTDFRPLRMHTSSTRNKAGHDFTKLKVTLARFVGTGCFLVVRNEHYGN